MPRCPLCRSALVTIGFGLYPIATCTSCNARWIQDGHQQRAINQVPRTHALRLGPLAGLSTAGRATSPQAPAAERTRNGDPLPAHAVSLQQRPADLYYQ